MKRVLVPVVVLLGLAAIAGGVFVWPTYRLKSSLADLAASLPPGYALTYAKPDYDLLHRTVTLADVHLHLKSGTDIDAAQVAIKGGNWRLDSAFKAAEAAPDAADQSETSVADRITVSGLHSVQGSLDIHVDTAEVDGLRLSLRSLLAPLAPELGSDVTPTDPVVRKIAVYATATAYDKLTLTGATLKSSDETLAGEAGATIAELTVDHFDHGDAAQTALTDFSMKFNDTTVTVGNMKSGNANHRAFWTALRGGTSLSDAVQKFQGASQTMEDVRLSSGPVTLGTIRQIDFGSIGYEGEGLKSLDLNLHEISFDPALTRSAFGTVLKQIGYDPVKLDFDLKVAADHAAGTMHYDPVTLTLDQGGTLGMTLDMSNARSGLSFQDYKLKAMTLRYDDHSLFTKYLAFLAGQANLPVDQMQQRIVTLMEQQRPNFERDKPLADSFYALETFVRDPKSLTIKLTPPVPVGMSDFDMKQPQNFTSKLGMVVKADQ